MVKVRPGKGYCRPGHLLLVQFRNVEIPFSFYLQAWHHLAFLCLRFSYASEKGKYIMQYIYIQHRPIKSNINFNQLFPIDNFDYCTFCFDQGSLVEATEKNACTIYYNKIVAALFYEENVPWFYTHLGTFLLSTEVILVHAL